MRKFAVKKDSFTVLADILTGTPEAFGGSSALSGHAVNRWSETGILPNDAATHWVAGSPVYAVYSYHTPIAWLTAGGEWIVPTARYSVTTSQHQGKVRAALSQVSGGYTEI
jgi:hypothetical protein